MRLLHVITAGAVFFGGAVAIVSCTSLTTGAAQLATTGPGQLVCALTQSNGGQAIVKIIDAAATGAATTAGGPLAGEVAVLAEGATAAFVQQACTAAAQATGAVAGIPVSPPAVPIASVAIKLPA